MTWQATGPLPKPNSQELLDEIVLRHREDPAFHARCALALAYAIPSDANEEERQWVSGAVVTAVYIADNVHRQ